MMLMFWRIEKAHNDVCTQPRPFCSDTRAWIFNSLQAGYVGEDVESILYKLLTVWFWLHIFWKIELMVLWNLNVLYLKVNHGCYICTLTRWRILMCKQHNKGWCILMKLIK
jgi:hypothetical protein